MSIDPTTLAGMAIAAVGPARNGIGFNYKQDVIDAAIAIQGLVEVDLPELLDCDKFTGILRQIGEGTGAASGGGNGVGQGRIALHIENTSSTKFSTEGEIDIHAGHWANSGLGKRMVEQAKGLIDHRVLVFKKLETTDDGQKRKTILRLVDLGPARESAPRPEQTANTAKGDTNATTGSANATTPAVTDADAMRDQVPDDITALIAKADDALGVDRDTCVEIAKNLGVYDKNKLKNKGNLTKLWEALIDHVQPQVSNAAEQILSETEDAPF